MSTWEQLDSYLDDLTRRLGGGDYLFSDSGNLKLSPPGDQRPEVIARFELPAFHKFKSSGVPWNPNVAFGISSPLALFFIIARIFGSTLVVPPLMIAQACC